MRNRWRIWLLATTIIAHLNLTTGCAPSAARRAVYARSGHYARGRFVNQNTTASLPSGNPFTVLWHFLTTKVPDREPAAPLPIIPLDVATLTDHRPDLVRVTWLGHSSSLVEIAGHHRAKLVGGSPPTRPHAGLHAHPPWLRTGWTPKRYLVGLLGSAICYLPALFQW